MSLPVFDIKNLQCEYVENSPVFEIGELKIPRGKLVFVIGKSGIGKSTLIETLGLMNRTIAQNDNTSIGFCPKEGAEMKELKDSWFKGNDELSKFRRNNFSFIFQNTNLMPNFSSGENMMVNLLIKGKSQSLAKKEVLSVMSKLSLESEIFDKKITELSGGQRQRLAFVRAVTSDFSVLFGDEPTGNLDENTANELMTVLKELIVDDNRTGIIVSHDLMLALKFADLIVPITANTENNDNPIGEIVQDNCLNYKDGSWQSNDGKVINKPINVLKQYLGISDLKLDEETIANIRS